MNKEQYEYTLQHGECATHCAKARKGTVGKSSQAKQCWYSSLKIGLLLAIGAVALISIGCGGEQPTLTDNTPPANPVELSPKTVEDISLAFSVENPNDEDIQARITFKPAFPEGATLTPVGGSALTKAEDGSFSLSIPKKETIQIQSSPINAETYTIEVTTSDTSGNRHRDDALLEDIISVDHAIPAQPVTITPLPGEGASLRFNITNTNNEAVTAQLTFGPEDLPSGTTLTYTDAASMMVEQTAPGPYMFSIPANGMITVVSSAINADTPYTIMMTITDGNKNSRTETVPLSLMSVDTIAPRMSVMLSEVSTDMRGIPFAFSVTNPNDETVDVDLTFSPMLTDSETVTVVGGSALTKAADNSFPLQLTADETTGDTAEIRLMSSAITDGSVYTITATTADTVGNDASSTSIMIAADSYGDSTTTAQTVTLARTDPTTNTATIQGDLLSGDTDYFTVTLAPSDGNTFEVLSTGDTDTVGSIEITSGTTVATDDNGADDDDNNFKITRDIAASVTYYIKVTGKNPSTSGPYSLTLSLSDEVPMFDGTPFDFRFAKEETTELRLARFNVDKPDRSGTLYWGAHEMGATNPPTIATLMSRATSEPVTAGYGKMDINIAATGSQFPIDVSGLAKTTEYDLYALLASNGATSSLMKITPSFDTTFYFAENEFTIRCDGPVGGSGIVEDTTYTKRDRDGILAIATADLNRDVPATCTTGIENMSALFKHKEELIGDISRWDTSSVTNMAEMFRSREYTGPGQPGNPNVLPLFDVDISNWDTSNVRYMQHMFANSLAFKQNIGSWNVTAVTDMSYMFNGATSFNGNIGGWERSGSTVGNVENMTSMFERATMFNQNIGGWVVSSVTTMNSMFSGATVFNNDGSSSINTWNVDDVATMNRMFLNAKAFNQDLSMWCVPHISTVPSVFAAGVMTTFGTEENKRPQWGSGTVAPCRPKAPTGLRASIDSGGASGIVLTWMDSDSSGANTPTGYRVYRTPSGGTQALITTVGATTTMFTDLNVTSGTTYTYIVRAVNAQGESVDSFSAGFTAP